MADARLTELFAKLKVHYGSYDAAARAFGLSRTALQKMRDNNRAKFYFRILLELWEANPKQYDEAAAAVREGRPIKWLVPPFLVERLERMAGNSEK